jgi:hypothetical protein
MMRAFVIAVVVSSIAPSWAAASDVVKDVVLSVLPKPVTPEEENGRKQLATLIDRIAAIPDDEIGEFPMVTNEQSLNMGKRTLDSPNFCERVQVELLTKDMRTIAAEATNGFLVAVAEGAQATGIDPNSEEIVPTQEMIFLHRFITKYYECL